MDYKTRHIPVEEFIRLWNGAADIGSLADLIGRTRKSCTVRAMRLRTYGFELHRFRPGPRKGTKPRRGRREPG